MKKPVPLVAVLLGIMLVFNSFSASKNPLVQPKNASEDPAKKEPLACFVKMNDGTIRNYTSLKLVTGLFITPHLLADEKTKIYPSEIKAYQNTDHFAVSQSTFTSGRHNFVAEVTLPGFAVRVAKGKVIMYCKKVYNGTRTIDEFFLQSGDDGLIYAYTPALMKEMAKDDPDALNYFNSKVKHTSLPEKLIATVTMVNNSNMVSKN